MLKHCRSYLLNLVVQMCTQCVLCTYYTCILVSKTVVAFIEFMSILYYTIMVYVIEQRTNCFGCWLNRISWIEQWNVLLVLITYVVVGSGWFVQI